MKRILCLTLALLMTLFALLCLPACSGKNKLPADFVKGDEIVIDNETPFVYDESTVKTAPVKTSYGKEEWHVDGLCGIWNDGEEDVPYSKVSSYFGNKIIRHRVADGQDTYYTVYSLPDNRIYYVFFRMKDDVLVRDILVPGSSKNYTIKSELKGRVTVILTTHYMEEAEALSDRIGILKNGRLLAVGTAEELKQKAGTVDFEAAFVSIVKEAAI